MELLYKVGDKVTVRLGLTEESKVPFGINELMLACVGETLTIVSVEPDIYSDFECRYPEFAHLCDGAQYRVQIEGQYCPYYWSSPMFVKVASDVTNIMVTKKPIKFNFSN